MKTRWAVLLFFPMACAQPLPIDNAPCPCSTGWVCCPGAQICATDLSQCPAPAAPALSPTSATVSVTRRFAFLSSDDVSFSVEEASGGTIDGSGLYTAPSAPGTYHVLATRTGSSSSTRAEVTVVPLQLAALAGRYGGLSSRPIDGVGEDARFAQPSGGVFVDGHYYLTDGTDLPFQGAQALRRIALATGKVETLFQGSFIPYPGTNLAAVTDGALGTATFAIPGAMASDGQGHLLVADACLIRSVDLADLSVTTLLGDVSLSSCARGAFIRGVASDGADTVFFSIGDLFDQAFDEATVIRKLTVSSGATAVIAGQIGVYGTDDGAQGTFTDVGLLTYDKQSGVPTQLIALDDHNQRVRAINLSTHEVSTLMGPSGAPYVEVSAPPAAVGGIVIRADGSLTPDGPVLQAFHQQLPLRPTGVAVTEIPFGTGGNSPPCDGRTVCPVLLVPTADGTFDQFNLYLGLLDTIAGRLGSPPEARDGNGQSASFALASRPPVIATAGDDIFAAEASRSIRKIDRAGNVTTAWSGVDAILLAGSADTLYLATTNAIRKAPVQGGSWTLVAGGTFGHSQDGVGAAAVFASLTALVVEPEGTLVALDVDNAGVTTLRRVDPGTGAVTTVATLPGMLDGSALSFALNAPSAARGPKGKLVALSNYGVHLIDLATGQLDHLFLDTMNGNPYSSIAYDSGRVYLGRGTVVDQLDPATKQLIRLAGLEGDGAVRPGPLDRALLHQVGGLATLPNGDVLVLDAAERVLMEVR